MGKKIIEILNNITQWINGNKKHWQMGTAVWGLLREHELSLFSYSKTQRVSKTNKEGMGMLISTILLPARFQGFFLLAHQNQVTFNFSIQQRPLQTMK